MRSTVYGTKKQVVRAYWALVASGRPIFGKTASNILLNGRWTSSLWMFRGSSKRHTRWENNKAHFNSVDRGERWLPGRETKALLVKAGEEKGVLERFLHMIRGYNFKNLVTSCGWSSPWRLKQPLLRREHMQPLLCTDHLCDQTWLTWWVSIGLS